MTGRDYDWKPFGDDPRDFDLAIKSLRADDPVRAMLVSLQAMVQEARKIRQDVQERLKIPRDEVDRHQFAVFTHRADVSRRLDLAFSKDGDPSLGMFAEFLIGSTQNIETEIRIATNMLARQAKRHEKYVADIEQIRNIRKIEGGIKALRSATISIFIKECAIVSSYILIVLAAIAAIIFVIHQFVLN